MSYPSIDDVHTNGYWQVDSIVTNKFMNLYPEGNGEYITRANLYDLFLSIQRPLKSDEELHTITKLLDSSNSMTIQRHDFVSWFLNQQLLVSDTNATHNIEDEKNGITKSWEQVWIEVVDIDQNPTVYYYNSKSKEIKMELPYFIMVLQRYLDRKMENTQELQLVKLDLLYQLFTKYDDDGSDALDISEFEDMCVAIGYSLGSSKATKYEEGNGIKELLYEINNCFQSNSQDTELSWEALSYYWITNAPYLRRTHLQTPYHLWEQFEDLTCNFMTVYFQHMTTYATRWNHPQMEQNIIQLLTPTIAGAKLSKEKKIDMFFEKYAKKYVNSKYQNTNQYTPNIWSVKQCRHVFGLLGHKVIHNNQVIETIDKIESIFGSPDKSSQIDATGLTQEAVKNWFLHSINVVERHGWEEIVNDQGEVYYYHEVSGMTQWDPPDLCSAMQDMVKQFKLQTTDKTREVNDKRLFAIFQYFDDDDSGVLELDEFVAFYIALMQGKNIVNSGTERKTNQKLKEDAMRVFQSLDIDRDKCVSFEEFKDWWDAKLHNETLVSEEEENLLFIAEQRMKCTKYLREKKVLYMFDPPSKQFVDYSSCTSIIGMETNTESKYFAFMFGLLGEVIEMLEFNELDTQKYSNYYNDLAKECIGDFIFMDSFLNWYQRLHNLKAKPLESKFIGFGDKSAHDDCVSSNKSAMSSAILTQEKDAINSLRVSRIQKQLSDNEIIQSSFEKFDKQKNGWINEKAVGKLLRNLGKNIPSRQLHHIMMTLDMTGSCKLNLEQFSKFWAGYQDKKNHKAYSSVRVGINRTESTILNNLSIDQAATDVSVVNDDTLNQHSNSHGLARHINSMFYSKKETSAQDKLKAKVCERSNFIPTKKRLYGCLDVTWIEPEIVEAIVEIISTIKNTKWPLLQPDAAQRIQSIGRRHLAKLRVSRIIDSIFWVHIDLHTKHYYFVRKKNGELTFQRPVYRTSVSSAAPFNIGDCKTKMQVYQFQKQVMHMQYKKLVYDRHYRLCTSNESREYFVPAVMYMLEIIHTVKTHVLTNIWQALRNRQEILVELIARRYPLQLTQKSVDGSGSFPLHYVLRCHWYIENGVTKFYRYPDSVIKAVIQGYPQACAIKDAFFLTPLHIACRERRNVDIIQLLARTAVLYKKSIMENIWSLQSLTKDTPLHLAVQQNVSLDVMRWILCNGNASSTCIYMLNAHGHNPFHLALLNYNHEKSYIVQYETKLTNKHSLTESQQRVEFFLMNFDALALCSKPNSKGNFPIHIAIDSWGKMLREQKILPMNIEYQLSKVWVWLLDRILAIVPWSLWMRKATSHLLPIHLGLKYGLPEPYLIKMLFYMQALRNEVTETDFSCSTLAMADMPHSILAPPKEECLLHYTLRKQPTYSKLLHLIIKLMPSAVGIKDSMSGELALHVAAASNGISVSIVNQLCLTHPSSVLASTKTGSIALHLAVQNNQTVAIISAILDQMHRYELSQPTWEPVLVVLNRIKPAVFHAINSSSLGERKAVIKALLKYIEHIRVRPEYDGKYPTPLYALSVSKNGDHILDTKILHECINKFEREPDNYTYFEKQAKTLAVKQHNLPSDAWSWKKIVTLIETHPCDNAILQRAFLAINTKLNNCSKSAILDSKLKNSHEYILSTITLNKQLDLVKRVHHVMYEFTDNSRIQILGQKILQKLLPSAYSKAIYKAKVDPQYNR